MAEMRTAPSEGALRVAAWHRFSGKFLFFIGLPAAFLVGAYANETNTYWVFVPFGLAVALLDAFLFLLFWRTQKRPR